MIPSPSASIVWKSWSPTLCWRPTAASGAGLGGDWAGGGPCAVSLRNLWTV
jgi:hypothetical protein